jgi:hypothetical protein
MPPLSGVTIMRFIAILAAAGIIGAPCVVAADCGCGPLYCLGAPDFPARLAAKKTRLEHQGAAKRLTSLLDKNGQCQGCLDTGPDGFTILNVMPDGDNYTISWDADNEAISHRKTNNGELSAYYIFNTRKACACCGEPKSEARSDYDSRLDLNKDLAIACRGGAPTASWP